MRPLQILAGLTIGLTIAIPVIIIGLIGVIFSRKEEPPWI